MKMRRKCLFVLTGVLSVVSFAVSAQTLEGFRQRLERPVTHEASGIAARVAVEEYGDAALLVAAAAEGERSMAVKGYRVCIFADNGEEARAGAVAAKNLFAETFPGIRVYMSYENPYFRVTVGDCLTVEEAIILKGRVSGTFPKAFPKSEQLSLADFAR